MLSMDTDKKIQVALLMGGPSPEYDVSLATGKVVSDALDRSKYDVQEIVIPKDGNWQVPHNIDVAFIAMHGAYGEDGTVQQLLEDHGIAYTGSGVAASSLAMDKVRSSELFTQHGLLVPDYLVVGREDTRPASQPFGYPVVVKPTSSGSSVGVTIVKEEKDLSDALAFAFLHGDRVMIQKHISGTEVTCGILDEGTPIALPPTEIVPKGAQFFDYGAKYTPGASEEITPARFSMDVLYKIQTAALKAHEALGCSHLSRTDMIVTGGDVYVLETNTIPGMTKTSLFPQAAAVAGIPFPELLDRLIEVAIKEKPDFDSK
jgi:D-alanine-D-alanine ligase